MLSTYGVGVNSLNSEGENALIEALRVENERKRDAIFRYLVRSGADVYHRDHTTRGNIQCTACAKSVAHQTSLETM